MEKDKNMKPDMKPRIPCLSIPQAHALLQDGAVCVADCRGRLNDSSWGRTAFAAGHIPGALFWDGEGELCLPPHPRLGRHPMPDPVLFTRMLRQRGYERKKAVLAYGFYAFRFLWLLDLLGFEYLHALDGTWEDWEEAFPGGFGEGLSGTVVAGESLPAQWDQGKLAVAGELLHLSEPLVDCRARERYLGLVEPLDPVAGHIPGAVNLPWTDVFDQEGHLLMPAPRGDEASALAGRSDRPVLYCGSGVTACAVWLGLLQWGQESRIYPGGWSAWIGDPERPVAAGPENAPRKQGEEQRERHDP